MTAATDREDRSWFRSAAGLRFAIEIGLIVAAKIALLAMLYFAFVGAQPRADTSSSAVRSHMLPDAPAARRDAGTP